MGNKLSFGYVKDSDSTLKSWVPKLREMVSRLISLEEISVSEDEVVTNETLNGLPVYQKLVECGALPSSGGSSIDHGVSDYQRIWVRQAWASRPDDSTVFPLPYIGASNNDIRLTINASHVILTTTSSSYTAYRGFVLLGYTRD